jgi:hypothetical protein
VWDLATGRVITAVAVGGGVGDGQFNPDGTRFTTVRLDGWLGVWSTETGALVAAFDDPAGNLTSAFAPTGDQLFAARRDGAIRVIDLRRTRLRREFTPPAGETVIDATADGTVVVTRRDATATAWDVTTGAVKKQVTLDTSLAGATSDELAALGYARPTAATPGPFAATVGDDAMVLIQDDARRELAAFPTARVPPTIGQASYETAPPTARFAPDGAIVIVSTGVAVWELPIEQRTPETIAAIAAARVPWRVERGTLIDRTAELRVTAPGATDRTTVAATRLPDTVEGSKVGHAVDTPHPATRRSDGSFVVALTAGRYSVTVATPGQPAIERVVLVKPTGATVTIDPSSADEDAAQR